MLLKKLRTRAVMTLWVLNAALSPMLAGAAEVTFPLPAYTPDELVTVREWEKTWAGKKIDTTNIDQVAEFLPDAYVTIMKEPEKWNAPPGEGNWFTIVPYRQVLPTADEIEATKKYAPLVQTDGDGIITNYTDIAGTPFPHPKTGLEVAYNLECNTRGDTSNHMYDAPNVNPRTKTDRISKQELWYLYYIHRVAVDPRPAIPDNRKGYHRGEFLHMFLPPEMLNTRFFTMRFIDHTKEDVSYLYYAQYRRIRRLSTSERTNAIDGTDQIYDDGNMWDGHLSRNSYELNGTKEMLLCRHQDMQKVTRRTGQAMANGFEFERCNTYVIEVINEDPNYLYSKRVWYVDPENYIIMWQDAYDELGRYWKCFMHATDNITTEQGDTKNYFVGFTIQDMQRTHSGFCRITPKKLGGDIKPSMFTLSNLQKTY